MNFNKSFQRWMLFGSVLFVALTFIACDDDGGSGGGGAGGGDTVVTISAIPGVTPPSYSETPVREITETDQYTGTVSWSPSDTTFGYKIYTATITLTAKSGYPLTGVTANFFTVAGTSTAATNPADTGVVTAIFPQADWATTYNLRDTGPAGGLIF